MKRDAATAELSREELEAEVAALRSENAQLRTAPLPPLNPLPPLAPLPAFDPLASPPASPAVLGADWGGGVAPVPVPASPAVLGADYGGGVAPVPMPANQSPLSPAPAPAPPKPRPAPSFRPADRVEFARTGEQGVIDRVWKRGELPGVDDDDGPFVDVAFGSGEVGTFKARYFRPPTAPPRLQRWGDEPPAALLYAEKVAEPAAAARDSDSDYNSKAESSESESDASEAPPRPAVEDEDSDDALIWVPKKKTLIGRCAPGEALVCPACEASYTSGHFCPKCEKKLVPRMTAPAAKANE